MVPIVADWTGEVQRGRSARRAQSAAREVHRPRHARRARVSADAAVRGATKMMRRQSAARLFLGAASVLALCVGSAGQGLDPAALLKPAVDSWPTYHGDYSGQRHSPLTQITPANVAQLTLAWAFQTGQSAQIKATPILVNGIVYVSAPDQLWAIDARSGRQLWQYRYPENAGFHIGHRGLAVYKGSVYLTTPDAHLVALDARNGTVRWNVEIADSKKGYWSTNAPLLVRNHLLVGVAGDFDNLPGMLTSIDPETGKTQWIFYSTPPPGTPAATSGGATDIFSRSIARTGRACGRFRLPRRIGPRGSTRPGGRFRIPRRSRRATGGSSRRTKAVEPTIARPVSIRRPVCSSSARRIATG